ncbi:hypothetical protein PQQ73_14685 [Paraburkholderia strydomiana]|uniref:Uncharacterized protein n=1 Tax=Paraburkholderia strydomiana TaxID=1245417 RepID=A0ABW9EDU8_9BURK
MDLEAADVSVASSMSYRGERFVNAAASSETPFFNPIGPQA